MTEPENEILDAEIIGEDTAEEKPLIARKVGRFVVRSSVRFVVSSAVATLVPTPETKRDKVRLFIGTYAISGMVAKHAQDFIDTKFDEWKQDIVEIRIEMKKFEDKRNADDDTTTP